MKYHIIGNIYKDKYVICNCAYSDFYSKKPYTKDKIRNYSEGVGGSWANYYEYDLDKLNVDFFMYSIESYGKHREGENKRKINKIDILTNHEWVECGEVFAIESDREFRSGEKIKLGEKEYEIIYRYNTELKRHELYIDYDISIEKDCKLEARCKNKLTEINRLIEKYNEVSIKTETKNKNNKTFIGCIKKVLFKKWR